MQASPIPMRTLATFRCLFAGALAAATLALAGASHAQIYKCVDANGHTTYQQEPCADGQRGGTVELKEPVTVPSDTNAPLWSAAAREHRIVVGMPKTFVTEALGRPTEIRAPRSDESGSEVWVYPQPTQTTRLGFVNNAVAWIRYDAAPARKPGPETAQPVAGPVSAALAPARQREARVREALVVGKTCTAALQDAGPADREEPLTGGPITGSRYVYTFDASNPNAYAAFVCLNGRVTSVERFTTGETKAGS